MRGNKQIVIANGRANSLQRGTNVCVVINGHFTPDSFIA